jgi:hypothetical protein
MNPLLTKCPVCNAELLVTRLHCPSCDTVIEGSFASTGGPLARLTPEQVQFVFTFVRCEGRFNRMEDEMGISYPTIRNRLYEVIRALGFEPGKEDPVVRLTPDDRRRILEELEQGKINPEQARKMLQGVEA